MKLGNLVDFSRVTNWVSTQIASSKASENKFVSQVAKVVFTKVTLPVVVGIGCFAWASRAYKIARDDLVRKEVEIYNQNHLIVMQTYQKLDSQQSELNEIFSKKLPAEFRLDQAIEVFQNNQPVTLSQEEVQKALNYIKSPESPFAKLHNNENGRIVGRRAEISDFEMSKSQRNSLIIRHCVTPILAGIASFAVAAFVLRKA